jgi:hypothetical protein
MKRGERKKRGNNYKEGIMMDLICRCLGRCHLHCASSSLTHFCPPDVNNIITDKESSQLRTPLSDYTTRCALRDGLLPPSFDCETINIAAPRRAH